MERSESLESIESIDTETVKPTNKNDYKCAPSIKFNAGSCIDLPVLIEMARAYNETNTNKIKLHPKLQTLNPKKYKKYLLKEFKKRYNNVCTTQLCWTQQDFVDKMNEIMRDELTKFTYRPNGPVGKFEWLNTTHLNEVMEQYEKVHKDFKFLGAVPMDFDSLPVLGIKDLNLDDLINMGISKLGIIFNLDNHNQSGSHWVAGYADLKNGKAYFFDSYGIEPDPRARKLLRRFAKYSEEKFNAKVDSIHNETRHQYGNSECGMYSLNFILELLDGKTFNEICAEKIPDTKVNHLRPIFFYNVNF
jgi:hypothetical protein